MPTIDPLLRTPEVLRLTSISRSHLYRETAAGRFPKPVRATPAHIAWRASEVADWIANRPRADTPLPRSFPNTVAT